MIFMHPFRLQLFFSSHVSRSQGAHGGDSFPAFQEDAELLQHLSFYTEGPRTCPVGPDLKDPFLGPSTLYPLFLYQGIIQAYWLNCAFSTRKFIV